MWVSLRLKKLVDSQGSHQERFYGLLQDHKGLQVDSKLGVNYCKCQKCQECQ